MSPYTVNCSVKLYAEISLVFMLSLCDCFCFRYWHSGIFILGRLRSQRQLSCVNNPSMLFSWRLVSLREQRPSARAARLLRCPFMCSLLADTQPCRAATASWFMSLQEKLLIVAAHREHQWKATRFDRRDWVSTFFSIFIFCKFLGFRPLVLPVKQWADDVPLRALWHVVFAECRMITVVF